MFKNEYDKRLIRAILYGPTDEEIKSILKRYKKLRNKWYKENKKHFSNAKEALAYYHYCMNQR